MNDRVALADLEFLRTGLNGTEPATASRAGTPDGIVDQELGVVRVASEAVAQIEAGVLEGSGSVGSEQQPPWPSKARG